MHKIDEFYQEMKKRNYTVRFDRDTDSHANNNTYIVTKEGYYHVAINQIAVLEAPIEYLIDKVEKQFELLTKPAQWVGYFLVYI